MFDRERLHRTVGLECHSCPLYDPGEDTCGRDDGYFEEAPDPEADPYGDGDGEEDGEDGEDGDGDGEDGDGLELGKNAPKPWVGDSYWSPPPGTTIPEWDDPTLFKTVEPPPGLWIDRRFYGLKRRLESILVDNRYKRKAPLKRSGEIDLPRLWKVRMDRADVFRRQQELKGRDYACVMAVDLSGSMYEQMSYKNGADCWDDRAKRHYFKYGSLQPRSLDWDKLSRIEAATEIASQLAFMLESLGVSTTIIGYNHKVKVFQSPGDRPRSPHVVRLEMLESFCRWGACNHDLEALLKSLEELDAQKVGYTQPFFILLSDGRPAGCGYTTWRGKSWSNASEDACRECFNYIKMKYPAVAIGLGLDISDIYPGARRVMDSRQLNTQLAGAIQHVIHRR